jgi:multiple sugar transport system substrate-binding protein
MSNNSVRKALDTLVDEGWIEKIPRVGNRVSTGGSPVSLTLSCNVTAIRNLELERLIEDFQRRYFWISVKIKPSVQLLPGFGTQGEIEGSDLILLNNMQFRQLTEAGFHSKLEPVSPLPGLYPFLSAWFTHGETAYAQPIVFSPIVLIYNKRHFRDAGLPEPNGGWRWDDLVQSAVALSDGKGRYGFCFHLPSVNRWPLFLLQSEERFEREDGRLRDIRGTGLLESIRLCRRILHNRDAFPLYMSEDNSDINRMFVEGKISMVLGSYMSLNDWKDAELDYDVTPIPFIRHPVTLAFSIGAVINKSTPYKEAARQFVEYIASRQGQQFIGRHTLSIPALQELAGHIPDSAGHVPGRFGLYREIVSSYRTHDDLGLSTAELYKMFTLLKPYWGNMENEEELCERILHSF